MKKLLFLTIMMTAVAIASAQVINVPGDQPSIQAGIDAATSGDVILVAEGTYFENINFRGKAITVASLFWDDGDTSHINNTIIDGSMPVYPDTAAVVIFNSGEDTTSILYGFSITGGLGGLYNSSWDCDFGAGIAFYEAGGRISYNKIFDNELNTTAFGSGGAGVGGMMNSDGQWVIIEHNEIYNNTSSSNNYSGFGGGILFTNCIITNNAIYNNSCMGTDGAHASGGGLEVEELPGSTLEFKINYNEVFNNSINGEFIYGAGISLIGGSGVVFGNHIYDNSAQAIDRCLGGGLRTLSSTGKVILDNNIVSGNIMIGNYLQGAGIDVGGGEGQVSLINNHVFNNESIATTASWGSGISLVQNQDLIIKNNEIHNNLNAGGSWWCGAGINCEALYGSMEISSNIIADNIGTGTSYGGAIGIYDTEGASYIIESNQIKRNHCNYGAGVWTFNTYDMTMMNNMFVGNVAGSWGGAYGLRQNTDDHPLNISIASTMGESLPLLEHKKSDNHPLVINNTFYNNVSIGSGGAIHSDQSEQTPIFINNIFYDNNAYYGDDIYYTGPDTLSIFNCNINYESDTNILANWTGHGNIYDDPLFGDTNCHIGGGPCHNTGIESLELGGITYYAPDADFEGTPRPQGPAWDIGADECLGGFISTSETSGKLKLVIHPNPNSGALNLRYLIADKGYLIAEVYSVKGIKVKTLMQGNQLPGEYEQSFDISELPNGIYFIRLQAGKNVETAKVILMK